MTPATYKRRIVQIQADLARQGLDISAQLYFPHFAVHVEDTFVVTRNGAEVLTPAPRELKVLR